MAREVAHREAAESPHGGGSVDVLTRIRGALPSLAPSERRVADTVLAAPSEAAGLSISALAYRASTSVATVMRFCRAIGLTNYPHLRVGLAAAAGNALGAERPALGTDIGATDSLEQIISKIIYNEVRALEESRDGFDVAQLGQAVDAVADARRIDIFGVGASGFVGQDLHQKLHRIGRMAFIWTDVHAALTAAALLEPRTWPSRSPTPARRRTRSSPCRPPPRTAPPRSP